MPIFANAALAAGEVSRLDQLIGLEREWKELWKECSSASPFSHPAWAIPWFRRLGDGELITIAFRGPPREQSVQMAKSEEGARRQLVGLAPLYIYAEPDGTRKVFFVGTGTSDRLDVLALPGDERRIAAETVRFLAAAAQRWDVVEFSCLGPESALYELLREHAMPCEVSPALDLSARSLEAALPKGMYNKLRYFRRRIEKNGRVEIVRADSANVLDLFDTLVKLHAARWCEKKHEAGIFGDPRVVDMHRESLPKMLEAGLLHMFLIKLNGADLAVYYGFKDTQRKRCYSYISGFDPAHIELSPGRLVVGQAIEDAIADGVESFDFLRGSEPYKYAWGAKDQTLFRVGLDRLSIRISSNKRAQTESSSPA